MRAPTVSSSINIPNITSPTTTGQPPTQPTVPTTTGQPVSPSTSSTPLPQEPPITSPVNTQPVAPQNIGQLGANMTPDMMAAMMAMVIPNKAICWYATLPQIPMMAITALSILI